MNKDSADAKHVIVTHKVEIVVSTNQAPGEVARQVVAYLAKFAHTPHRQT